MNIQKSFSNNDGILYIIPTPIGNLEDMTFRAIRILKEAHLIAAEDTRNTKKLLNYFEISTPLTSYHDHNKESSGRYLIEKLKQGQNIALVSDAGMPAISDPGYELVESAIEEGIPVVPLPGANAAITALVASGIKPQPFYFYGFLPRKKKERDEELNELKKLSSTIIFYEAPHRLKETVLAIYESFGDRKVTLCRELTKKYEEFARGHLSQIIQWLEENEPRGEYCIIIEGTTESDDGDTWWINLSTVEHVEFYISQGEDAKTAIKKTAKDRGLGKREVYQQYHNIESREN